MSINLNKIRYADIEWLMSKKYNGEDSLTLGCHDMLLLNRELRLSYRSEVLTKSGSILHDSMILKIYVHESSDKDANGRFWSTPRNQMQNFGTYRRSIKIFI